MRKVTLILLYMCVASMSLLSCSSSTRPDPRQLTAVVSIEGSDTMAALLTSWANQFMKSNPNIPVSVNAGDTARGITALINRTTDIAAASGNMTSEQEKLVKMKNIRLNRSVVARDCLAIIVNPSNALNELTLEELHDLMTGKISNWSQVHSKSGSVKLFVREATSGTNEFFLEHVLHGLAYAKTARVLVSGDAVVDAVASDKSGIGYVGMGTAFHAGNRVKILALKLTDRSSAVKPSPESTFLDYPLCRPLVLYTDEPAKPSVNQFIDFCLTPEGQKIAHKSGFATVHRSAD